MQDSWVEEGFLTYRGDYYRERLVSPTQCFSIQSKAIGVDIPIQLFIDLFNWKKSIVSHLSIQVTELQDLEERMEKITAIEDVFGMLNDLNSEQLKAFETSVKRRDLFK